MKEYILMILGMKRFIVTMFIISICLFADIFIKKGEMVSIKFFKERTKSIIGVCKEEIPQWVKPTFILFMIYLVGISAILRANFYYIDDLGRNFLGNSGWSWVFSRYISDIASPFLHGDPHLTDISPLTQVIATILIAIASVSVLHLLTGKKKFSFFEYVSVIPLGLSPYFLECLSYKFDSPYLSLSVLASVFPLLFYKKRKSVYALMCIICILIMCTTYQASSAIFPMLVILLALMKWNRKEDSKHIFEFVGFSALWYVLALIIFRVFLMVEIEDSYVTTSQGSISNLIPLVFNNFKTYVSYILTDFKIEWIVLIGLICLSVVYIMVRDTKRNKTLTLVVTIISLLLMVFISFGIYLLLYEQKFSPRTMYAFGAFIAFVACVVAASPKVIPAKLICLSLSWIFFVFSFTYGNALFVQKSYVDFRIQRAVDDIIALDIVRDKEHASSMNMQIEGTIGHAQAIRNMPQDYQILNRLVPVTFCGDWRWGYRNFQYYYGLHDIAWNESIDLEVYDLPVLEDNIYHTIKGNEKYILLELKE